MGTMANEAQEFACLAWYEMFHGRQITYHEINDCLKEAPGALATWGAS